MNRQFHLLLVHGPYPLIRGFISGFLLGKGVTGKVFYCSKSKIEVDEKEEKFTQKLKEWIGFHRYLATNVVVESGVYDAVVEAIRSSRHDLHIDVESDHLVKSASFEVEFRTYSEEVGEEIKKMVKSPPEGLKTAPGFRMDEIRRDDAEGAEGYAPEHEYELKGSGEVVGDLDKLVAFRDRIEENPLVHCEPIRIELEEA